MEYVECHTCNPGFRPHIDRTNCTYIQPIIILSLIGIAATTLWLLCLYFTVTPTWSKHQVDNLILYSSVVQCFAISYLSFKSPNLLQHHVQSEDSELGFVSHFASVLCWWKQIKYITSSIKKSLTVQAPPLISPQSQLFFTALLIVTQVLIATVWLVVKEPNTTFLICMMISPRSYIAVKIPILDSQWF